jgi:hypothetical protein
LIAQQIHIFLPSAPAASSVVILLISSAPINCKPAPILTRLPAGFVIHSFATLAALQCEDHIGRAENSEPALEAGGRIKVGGAGWSGRLVAAAGVESCRGLGVRGVTGGGAEIFY